MKVNRREFLQLLASGTAAFVLSGCEPGSSDLTVMFLDVGKADAILLTTAGSSVMIDTGTASTANKVVAAINDLGISSLDELIITHFDQDHVGGAAAVLDNFPVKEVFVSYEAKESEEVEAYHKALTSANIDATQVLTTTERSYDGVSYTIIPPEAQEYEEDTSNNSSLVVRAKFGSTSMLFTGDIQKERIDELLASGADLKANLLKVPHHGKREDNSDALFAAVKPQYAVITSSDDDKESNKVVKSLESLGAQVFLTREGAVKAVSDGSVITVTQ